jgi:lipoprotein-releasing system ATP-binding protein
MSDILTVKGLVKTYQNGPQTTEVIKGIDLTIIGGQVVIIVGPSGVGKSTLLHLIGGLDKPTAGEISIDGKNVFALGDKELAVFRNRNIGFVFQFHHLLPEFTALENVMIPGMMHDRNIGQIEQNARALLDEVGLSQRLTHKPSQLSGGEQQRVAVARSLINKPKLVLADEPTGNLDKRNSQTLYQLILSLNRKFNQTFLIVTHNELMAEQASQVIEMEDGRVKSINRNVPDTA